MSTQLNALKLKCPSCGATLVVTPDMERFACGYCGTEQTVRRQGGTVALRLVTEAISRVQAGTDRMAAEMAIKRLNTEIAALKSQFQKLRVKRDTDLFAPVAPRRYGLGLSIFGVICFFFNGNEFNAFSGGSITLGVIFLIVSSIVPDPLKKQLRDVASQHATLIEKLSQQKAIADK